MSLTVKQLRKIIESLPDDVEVRLRYYSDEMDFDKFTVDYDMNGDPETFFLKYD